MAKKAKAKPAVKKTTKAKAKPKTVVKKTTAVRAKPQPKPKVKAKTPRKSGLNQQTYELSPELQAIVGASKLTRPQIVKKLWVYIKAHKCQDAMNKRMIVPDKKLAEVIGKKPVDMLKLAGCLNKHIL